MRKLIDPVGIFISLSLINFMVESKTVANVCKDITSKSKSLQLKTHLFCDYDPDVRPQNGKKNATNVGIVILAKAIEFVDYTNILTLHSWTPLNWTDPFLTWNPKDFDGISSLQVKSSDIWTPDIKVHNSADASDDQGFPKTECNIYHDGLVICMPAMKYTAHCDSDYTNFPYDFQNCSLQLSSWSYSNDELNLHVARLGWSDYSTSREWEIWDVVDSLTNKTFKMNETFNTCLYTIHFTLLRRFSALHIVNIAPAIALMVLTLSVLWLDCLSTERMIVASISFISHLLCIQNVYFIIPHNGGVSPNLLRFYENSFLLMGLSLVLTVLLRELRSIKTNAPTWLNSATLTILHSRPGQLLLFTILDPKALAFFEAKTDDNADLVQEQRQNHKPGDSTWEYVTLLIGWLVFVSVFSVYVIMLIVLMPAFREK